MTTDTIRQKFEELNPVPDGYDYRPDIDAYCPPDHPTYGTVQSRNEYNIAYKAFCQDYTARESGAQPSDDQDRIDFDSWFNARHRSI